MLSRQEAFQIISRNELLFPPLKVASIQIPAARENRYPLDAILQVEWQSRRYDFGMAYAPHSTPKAFQSTLRQVIPAVEGTNLHPMVMMPYLSEDRLQQLEAQSVSGLDLSGNGVIIVPDNLLVYRSGSPNKYPSSAPIKNIYRGTSSLVPRVFLARPTYPSVNAILNEIYLRNGLLPGNLSDSVPLKSGTLEERIQVRESRKEVALSTVSKALKVLEDDLVVGRESGVIRLLQPELLLEKLVENYRPPTIRKRFYGKLPDDLLHFITKLMSNAAGHPPILWTTTSAESCWIYGIRTTEPVLTVYCQDIDRLLSEAAVAEAERFYNIVLLETDDVTVYFDRVKEGDKRRPQFLLHGAPVTQFLPYASPVQTYLELMQGDKRDREAAEQVKRFILKSLEEQNP